MLDHMLLKLCIQANSEILSLLLDQDKIYALSQTSVTMIPSEYDCGKPKTCQ